MNLPEHLLNAKICNKDTCEEIRTLKEELEKKNKKYWQSKCFEYQVENRRLKERIEYLERSNNRREDTIMSLRDEIIDQKDYENVLNEFEKWLIDLKTPKTNYWGDRGYTYMLKIDVILDKLNELKESDK